MNAAVHFENIVNEHYEPLFRFALSLTRIESDARDLTQETFFVWAHKGHQLRDIAKVKTWLFTTLHRVFLAARRKQSRYTIHNLEEAADELSALCTEPVNPVDCSLVLPALSKVDEVYQAAVALFYLEDCSYNEIAAILEVPVGTVKSRIARGVAQLKEILLSGSSRGSSFKGDGLPWVNAAGPGRIPAVVPTEEGDYAEWDFSSTRLEELSSVA
jgi:RNA polymerase sigma-70 factor (ECF subfamily)